MAIHKNLVIEDDRVLSSKIGRVLFLDFQKNPNLTLNPGDIIKKGNEKLKIGYMQQIRTINSEGITRPMVGVKII